MVAIKGAVLTVAEDFPSLFFCYTLHEKLQLRQILIYPLDIHSKRFECLYFKNTEFHLRLFSSACCCPRDLRTIEVPARVMTSTKLIKRGLLNE